MDKSVKYLKIVTIAILVFLAVSSGVTKIALMEQDVAFFGAYGFTNPLLMAFGAIQLVGGLLLIAPKTRKVGAILVGITFAISAVLLFLHGSIIQGLVTCVALAGLAWVSRKTA